MKAQTAKGRNRPESALSLEQSCEALGLDCGLSDEQSLVLRDQLLALAALLVDTYLEKTAQGLTWSHTARAWLQAN